MVSSVQIFFQKCWNKSDLIFMNFFNFHHTYFMNQMQLFTRHLWWDPLSKYSFDSHLSILPVNKGGNCVKLIIQRRCKWLKDSNGKTEAVVLFMDQFDGLVDFWHLMHRAAKIVCRVLSVKEWHAQLWWEVICLFKCQQFLAVEWWLNERDYFCTKIQCDPIVTHGRSCLTI